MANGVVFESIRPRDYEIGPWLSDFVASKGCSITQKGLAMLTDHLGTDISKISNEIGKLLVSLPEGTRQITDVHIEENVGISKDFNSFELCKAVVTRDVKRALTIAEHFFLGQFQTSFLSRQKWHLLDIACCKHCNQYTYQ